MLTFKKGENVKYIDPESRLIPVLEADGWQSDVEEKPKRGRQKKDVEATDDNGE